MESPPLLESKYLGGDARRTADTRGRAEEHTKQRNIRAENPETLQQRLTRTKGSRVIIFPESCRQEERQELFPATACRTPPAGAGFDDPSCEAGTRPVGGRLPGQGGSAANHGRVLLGGKASLPNLDCMQAGAISPSLLGTPESSFRALYPLIQRCSIRPVRPMAMQGIWDGMGALRALLGISPQHKARSSDMAASGPARPPSVPAAWWGHPFGGQRKSGRQFPCIGAACVAEELAPG